MILILKNISKNKETTFNKRMTTISLYRVYSLGTINDYETVWSNTIPTVSPSDGVTAITSSATVVLNSIVIGQNVNIDNSDSPYTANYDGFITCDTSGGSISITLPPVSVNIGKVYTILKNNAANSITVTPDGSDTIDGGASATLTFNGELLTIVAQKNTTIWTSNPTSAEFTSSDITTFLNPTAASDNLSINSGTAALICKGGAIIDKEVNTGGDVQIIKTTGTAGFYSWNQTGTSFISTSVPVGEFAVKAGPTGTYELSSINTMLNRSGTGTAIDGSDLILQTHDGTSLVTAMTIDKTQTVNVTNLTSEQTRISSGLFDTNAVEDPFSQDMHLYFDFADTNQMAKDVSGNKYHGTNLSVNYAATHDSRSNVAYFDANGTGTGIQSQRIEIVGDAISDIVATADQSITFWFKNSQTGLVGSIINLYDVTDGINNERFQIFKSSGTGVLFCTLKDSGGTVQWSIESDAAVDDDVGYFVHLKIGSGGAVLYINDSPQAAQSVTTDLTYTISAASDTFDKCIIGAQVHPSFIYYRQFTGYLADIVFWNRQLTTVEATLIYGDDYGYSLVVLAGQSNMRGAALTEVGIDDDYSLIAGRVFQYGCSNDPATRDQSYEGTSITAAENGLDHFVSNATKTGFWKTFCENILDTLPARRKLLLIPSAESSTGFNNGDWRVGDTLYLNVIAQTNAAMALRTTCCANSISAFLWHQGENDSWANQTYFGFLENFRVNVIVNITGMSTTTPFIMGTLREVDSNKIAMNAGYRRYVDNKTRFLVEMTDLPGITGDLQHFSAIGYRRGGGRYAKKYKEWLNDRITTTGWKLKNLECLNEDVICSTSIDATTGYKIDGASVLSATTLGSGVVTSSLTSIDVLNSGSITSGFGNIDIGSSILTAGLMSATSLAVDNISIDGSTIGLSTDTDLITLANNTVTIAGLLESDDIVVNNQIAFDGTTKGIQFINSANDLDLFIVRSGVALGSETDRIAWMQYDHLDSDTHTVRLWGSTDNSADQASSLCHYYNADSARVGIGMDTSTPANTLDVEGGCVIGSTHAGSVTAPTDGLAVEGSCDIGGDLSIGGALNSGSITSGFGSINNGSSSITSGGTTTFNGPVVCTDDFSVDTTDLVIDSSTNRISIGDGAGASYRIEIGGSDNLPMMRIKTTHSAGTGILIGRDTGVTEVSGNRLGYQLFFGAQDSSGTIVNGAGIVSYATQTWASGSNGSRLSFEVAQNGSASRTQILNVLGTGVEITGSVGIGGSPQSGVALHIKDDTTSQNQPIVFIQNTGTGEGDDNDASLVIQSTETGETMLSFVNYDATLHDSMNLIWGSDQILYFKYDADADTASGAFPNSSNVALSVDGANQKITLTNLEITGNSSCNDNIKSQFGTSNDLSIYHNGTDSVIENTTGDINIVNSGELNIGGNINASNNLIVTGDITASKVNGLWGTRGEPPISCQDSTDSSKMIGLSADVGGLSNNDYRAGIMAKSKSSSTWYPMIDMEVWNNTGGNDDFRNMRFYQRNNSGNIEERLKLTRFGAELTGSLEINSTTQAFTPPKMTTTQRDAFVTTTSGMVVYNTTLNELQHYDGSSWVGSSSLTSVGVLNSGSITSGFGDINIGSNTLTSDIVHCDTLQIGTDSDLIITHATDNVFTSKTGNLVFDNTNTSGDSYFSLGTDTNTTEFVVSNNSLSPLLRVKGSGDVIFNLGSDISDTSFAVKNASSSHLLAVYGNGTTVCSLRSTTSSSSFQVYDGFSTTLLSVDGTGEFHTSYSASMYQSNSENVLANAWTRVTYTDISFDTSRLADMADLGTQRITCQKTGVYRVSFTTTASRISTNNGVALYINGTHHSATLFNGSASATNILMTYGPAELYLTLTDYLEIYTYQTINTYTRGVDAVGRSRFTVDFMRP
jgi:hypothetical protein